MNLINLNHPELPSNYSDLKKLRQKAEWSGKYNSIALYWIVFQSVF